MSDLYMEYVKIFLRPGSKIFVEELSSDTAVLRRLPTKKWAKSSFFLINVAKSVGNPEQWAHPMRVEHGWSGPANEKRLRDQHLRPHLLARRCERRCGLDTAVSELNISTKILGSGEPKFLFRLQ